MLKVVTKQSFLPYFHPLMRPGPGRGAIREIIHGILTAKTRELTLINLLFYHLFKKPLSK